MFKYTVIFKCDCFLICLNSFSPKIISIVRSPVSNSTNVNVTFQVLNGSEPLLAYPVVQNIKGSNVTLDRAVGYTVTIVYFSFIYFIAFAHLLLFMLSSSLL